MIADLSRGSGNDNLALGTVAAVGVGASISTAVAGFLSARMGFAAGYFFLAACAVDKRAESLRIQLGLYHRRLRLIIRATFWLMMAIFAFIGTVLTTSVSVVCSPGPALPL